MDGFEFHLYHHESCGFGLVRFHILRLSNVGEMHFTDGAVLTHYSGSLLYKLDT